MAQKPDDVAAADASAQLALPLENEKKKAAAVDVATANRRKRRGVNILKVALLLLRRRSYKPSAKDVTSKGLWRRLVGSVRPLHLQSSRSPEQNPPPPAISNPPQLPSPSAEHFEEVLSPPISPNAPKSSSSSDDSESRYASAVNLQELDRTDSEGDSDDESRVSMNGGDEFIDAKAEEFIAQFYEQIRLQRSDAISRHNEKAKRSNGE